MHVRTNTLSLLRSQASSPLLGPSIHRFTLTVAAHVCILEVWQEHRSGGGARCGVARSGNAREYVLVGRVRVPVGRARWNPGFSEKNASEKKPTVSESHIIGANEPPPRYHWGCGLWVFERDSISQVQSWREGTHIAV